jgi:serine/threonine protein kinase
MLPAIGSLIANKYRLEALLGEGGMGAVYRARHELMDKPVALKWLKPGLGDQLKARQRFMQEARAAARIRHPNVVDVYDVGDQDGALFMVMQLLEGETFQDFLLRGDYALPIAIGHLLSAMRGVAAAHAVGITHRDIKPENIFINRDPLRPEGVVKILDFGISKLSHEPGPRLTTPGSALGTPHYMSWEQLCGDRDIDHRTDIYAFARSRASCRTTDRASSRS